MYHVTRLADMIETAFPGVTFPSSDARGLNENGDLVGEARLNGGQMQGFIYTFEHGVTALPLLPGHTSSAVRDVSDRDENGEIIIVGGGVPGPNTSLAIGEAALWRFSTVTGEVLETRGLGFPPGFNDSIAVAVSNGGIIVGYSATTGPFTNWKYDVSTQVLETFEFPARVVDLNNFGQVIGSTYRGDLFGNWEDLAALPGSPAAILNEINDLGWVVGRAVTSQSDGAGHFLVAITRYADPIGWTDMEWISHLSLAGGINDLGDFLSRSRVYLEDQAQEYSIAGLLSPESPTVEADDAVEINNHRQIAASQAHALLLTPLGVMIIPGDVNGDVQVNLDDHCAWVANPIDLNGDGAVDEGDEQWLLDRLAFFGFTVEDCNGNGAGDRCDILDGLSSDCDTNDVPDECQPDCSGDGVPDACEADCNGNGTADPCDIAQLTSLDCNENGIPDECDQGGVSEAINVFDPPVELVASATMTDDLSVTDVGIIDDVDFTIDVDYRIGDLTVLLSHDGTTITLIDRPGIPKCSSATASSATTSFLTTKARAAPSRTRVTSARPSTRSSRRQATRPTTRFARSTVCPAKGCGRSPSSPRRSSPPSAPSTTGD